MRGLALPLPTLNAAISRVAGETRVEPNAVIRDLTRNLARGEEPAFREFHHLYFDRLYHFLLVVTLGQEHAAQDALQETMLRVLRYVREFSDEDIFWSWLKAVARSAAQDGGRKQRRYLAALRTFAFGRREPAAASVSDEERLRDLIEEALMRLRPQDRQLIEGKYSHGFSVAELAAQTGQTPKAVESRLLRLRRELADALMRELRRR